MSAKAKSKLTPEQRNATLRRVLHKIKPYSLFVVCSLVVAAVSVAAQLYIPILCGNAIDFMLGKGSVNLSAVLSIVVEIIVEQGNHDELLAQGGFYATLYNSQFEGVET